ncbi:MAG: hypothetical protein RL198_24 [Actinomycetota bacterium]
MPAGCKHACQITPKHCCHSYRIRVELGSGLGGIALIVLAAIWLLVFVPGWAKKSQMSANPHLVSDLIPGAVPKEPARSSQLQRLTRTRRIFSLVLFVSLVFVATWFAVPVVSALGAWLPVSAGVSGLISLGMLVAANQTKRQIAVSRIEARNVLREKLHGAVTSNSEPAAVVTDPKEDLGWDPTPLPRPLSAPKIGALISPRVADVIPIKAQDDDSEQPVNRPTIELDEILRRRRVI